MATNFTSASSLALLGYQDLGYLFLGAGMIAWIIYEPVLFQRLRVLQIEPQFRPTMGIILAPAFVGSSAYLSLNGERSIFSLSSYGDMAFTNVIFNSPVPLD